MSFNYKDILRAPKLGFSAKKIWVGFLGLLVGIIFYSVFSYFAFACSPNWKFVEIWRQFRYVPVPVIGITSLTWYGWILWVVGVAFFIGINLLSIGAISKLTFEQLKGDEFYEVTDAIKFSLKQWKGIVLSPVVLAIFIAALIFTAFLLGLAGRIPYVGQILMGIFFIPIAFGALFVVYLAIVFLLSFSLSPAVSATSKSDTFDTLFELFSCLNDQTWRLSLWQAFVGFCSVAGVYIFGWLAKQALLLFHWSCNLWSGTRMIAGESHRWFDTIWQNGLYYLAPCPPIKCLEAAVGRLTPVLIYPQPWMQVNPAEWVGGFLIGIAFYFIAFFVIGYGIATWGAGQTLIYTVLVKMKDDKNLLEQKEEEFEEEEKEEKPEEKVEPEKEKEEKKEEKEEEKKEEKKEE